MAYTPIEPSDVGTSFTQTDTSRGTKNSQVEPPGYALGVYGHPSTHNLEIEFSRGYGEPTTQYTENNNK